MGWLPLSSTFCVVTPCPVSGDDVLVSALTDHQKGEWDLETIQRTFMPLDIDSILSIASSLTLLKDCLIWAPTPSRKFTVKSAYGIAWQERGGHVTEESSNAMCMKEFWKLKWRLWVPNKIWSFTWRACKNILPTKANLFCRRITRTGQHLRGVWKS